MGVHFTSEGCDPLEAKWYAPDGWCEDTGSGSILFQVERLLNGSTPQQKERSISDLRQLLGEWLLHNHTSLWLENAHDSDYCFWHVLPRATLAFVSSIIEHGVLECFIYRLFL